MSKIGKTFKKLATPAGILHPSGAVLGNLDPANAITKNMAPGLMRTIANPASGAKGGIHDPRKNRRSLLLKSETDTTGKSLLG